MLHFYSICLNIFSKDKDEVCTFLDKHNIDYDENPRGDNPGEVEELEAAGLPGWSIDAYCVYENTLTLEVLKKLEDLLTK